MCHFGGEVKHKNFIPESIVPNIIESFFDVKKRSHYVFSSVFFVFVFFEDVERKVELKSPKLHTPR